MEWIKEVARFFKFYIKDLAECRGIKITDEEVDGIVKNIADNDVIFEELDTSLLEILHSKGFKED